MSFLSIENLCVGYGKNHILKDINLDFQKGKFYGILGPNGTGKSTLLSAVTKIIKVNKGSVCIDGKSVEDYSILELAQKTALMSQEFQLKFPYSVEEIISMGRYPYTNGQLNVKDKEIIKLSMENAELNNLKDRKVNELSGGEKQRVLFGKVLCQDTDMILIDEGFSNMDIYYQIQFIKLLRKKAHNENKLIIFIMHDLNLARRYCDELLILKGGNVYDFGKSEEVLNDKALIDVFKVKGTFDKNYLELE